MEITATRRDYRDFLLFLYFGQDALTNPKLACVHRAYLDFNRTMHGIGEFPNTYAKAADSLLISISDLLQAQKMDQSQFDQWHQCVCSSLKQIYDANGFPRFSVGQAQKWINMTFKYIFTFGELKILGFEGVYKHCHVPLDNIIVRRLATYGPPKLRQPWSRIDDYREYLDYQKWIRDTFDMVPLDLELFVWMTPNFGLMDKLRNPSSIA